MMTEDKPIAKPIIDDATREKMALMFSGEVYLCLLYTSPSPRDCS